MKNIVANIITGCIPRKRIVSPVFCAVISLLATAFSPMCLGHAFSPSLLQVDQIGSDEYTVKWKRPNTYAGAIIPILPDKCSASSPVSMAAEGLGQVATWNVICSGPLADQNIGVEFKGKGGKIESVLLRINYLDNYTINKVLTIDNPIIRITAKDPKIAVTKDYLLLGFEHILLGFDHLLFVFGLLLLIGWCKNLLWTVTAFTLGHSLTLVLATLEIITVRQGPIEAIIALSIYVLAVEIISNKKNPNRRSLLRSNPWIAACGFGLLHGLGFAGALSEVGIPGHEVPLALFSFNVGIELGQLAFIIAVYAGYIISTRMNNINPALFEFDKGRGLVGYAPAFFIGSLAAYWMIQRTVTLI